MRPLIVSSAVNYVAAPATESGKSSIIPGVILEVRSQPSEGKGGIAVIDYTKRNDKGEAADPKEAIGHHTALARHSLGGEENTFHFADEAKEVKAAAQPAAAAPALNGSAK